jgi:Xaa-Pro aminopeptidase
MKTDLDTLMQERDLNALVVLIGETYSPQLDYLAGKVGMTHGYAIKQPGAETVLVAHAMEVQEARSSGLPVLSYADLNYGEIVKNAAGNRLQARASLLLRVLEHLQVTPGRVGLYGITEVSEVLALVDHIHSIQDAYTLVGEANGSIFSAASARKDADELRRIQSVAARTNEVLQATWDFIASHQLQGEAVVNAAGEPLTISAVKQFVQAQLAQRGLEEDGMIFAQGKDAGYPHSRGQNDQPLLAGRSIVFDLFPHERGGGYYHDVTRTWCIGYAPENVQGAYQVVRDAYDVAIEAYGLNKPTHTMQEAVQDFLEGHDHPTLRSHPDTVKGYMHSLGHGIGLNIHESPSIDHLRKTDCFEIGQVITIEPGLYYPDEGFGVRYENALYVAEDGSLVPLTDFRDDLVLPVRSANDAAHA